MPIITDSNKAASTHNGDTGSGILLSLDDEESFVVLERSTANDVGLSLDMASQPTQSFQTFSSNCSFPVFNNIASSGMISGPFSHSQNIPIEPVGLPFDNTNGISVSAEEIQKHLQEVLLENINLKENIYQTNLAMKQQLTTVRLLQDRALEVQKSQQSKFEGTKALILKLGSEKNELQEANNLIHEELTKIKEENKDLKECNTAFGAEAAKIKEENKELKESNIALGAEAAKLLAENANLKKELAASQEMLQTVSENGRKTSLQPTAKELELHELVDQLSRKLEIVERARRQQEFDIDKLQAQLGRAMQELNESERKLAHSENTLQNAQIQLKSENSLQYSDKLLKYDEILKQLKASIEEEKTRFNSLNSWLSMTDPTGNSAQFEISELRRLLAQEQSQSVDRKENLYQAVSLIQEMLSDFQKLGEELELLKTNHALKESHGLAYDELQKRGFTERLDSLMAKLVEKEEALAISERHLASLQEALRLQNDEKKDNSEIEPLKEQVQALTKEVDDKEKKLQANRQEMNSMNEKMHKLSSTNETIAVLEEQAKIFKDDFEAERKSRESLVAEKERLLEDLRHLQRRNQELIDELNRLRNDPTVQNIPPACPNPRRQERTPSPPPPRPMHRQFACPNSNCNQPFRTVEEVHLHVIECWGLSD